MFNISFILCGTSRTVFFKLKFTSGDCPNAISAAALWHVVFHVEIFSLKLCASLSSFSLSNRESGCFGTEAEVEDVVGLGIGIGDTEDWAWNG